MAKAPKSAEPEILPEANYRVRLTRPIEWRPGIVFRPGADHVMTGTLVQSIATDHPGAIEEAVITHVAA